MFDPPAALIAITYVPATSGVNDAVMYFVTRPAAVAVRTPLVKLAALTSGEVPPVAANVVANTPEVAGTDVIVPVTVAVSEAPVATAE